MKDQGANYLDRSRLPNEVEPLKDIVVVLIQASLKLWAELDVLKVENAALREENAELREKSEILTAEVNLLKQKVFGGKKYNSQKKSFERANGNANQNRTKHPGRQTPKTDLPRERIVYDIEASQKVCHHCQGFLSLIGEEASEQLELVRQYLKVIEHVRLKYACKSCCQCVVIAPTPYNPLEDLAGPNLMAHVVVSKFCDHLPLYSQEKILRRYGITLNRSTLCNWIQKTAEGLKPIYDTMQQKLVSTDYIFSDETPFLILRVSSFVPQSVSNGLDSEQAKEDQSSKVKKTVSTSKGYLLAYGRDGKHGKKPLVLYNFSLGRSGLMPRDFPKNFEGYLQVDGYGGYDRLCKPKEDGVQRCTAVGCWANVLRKFEEVLVGTQSSPSKEMIRLIGSLYEVERYAKEKALGVKGVKDIRQTKSQPILKEIHEWLWAFVPKVLAKGQLRKAISYTQNNWQALTKYVEDGRLAIDNNYSKRNIKLAVMGGKNYLFAGSESGGESIAILYSLIQTCQLNGVNPEEYLADVIMMRIQYHQNAKIEELLPHYWKPLEIQAQAA